MLGDILRAEGYEVDTVGDGSEALRLLAAARYDAVILDLRIRILGDGELRAQLLSDPDTAGIPVIVLTTDPTETREHWATAATALIPKPLDRDTWGALRAAVRLAVEVRAKGRET